jgi:hypothetical protein
VELVAPPGTTVGVFKGAEYCCAEVIAYTENDAEDEYDGILTVTVVPFADTLGIPGVARVVILDVALSVLPPATADWTVNE